MMKMLIKVIDLSASKDACKELKTGVVNSYPKETMEVSYVSTKRFSAKIENIVGQIWKIWYI